MYCFNRQHIILACVFCSLLITGIACKPDVSEAGKHMQFFDLKGYFDADAKRLTKSNPMVNKTVTHNTDTETQKLHIADWNTELSMFAGSDINKPAWKSSYNVQVSGDFLIYKAKDPKLITRDIIIKKAGDKIKWILIFNHNKNMLYESEEKLSYYPDSLYIIQKFQKVKLMSLQKYVIRGSFDQ